MDKVIIIVFKNGQRVVWEQNEWINYAYDGTAFIVKKGNDCYISFMNELNRFLNIESYGSTLGNMRVRTFERVRKQ